MAKRKRRNRLPPEPVVAQIESLNQDGRGVAHVDGKTLFVTGALPGERVLARYLKRQRRYDEAAVVEVIEASPQRIEPRCEHFGVCGGCALQHLSDADQVDYKQQSLLQTLRRIGHVEPAEVLAPLRNDSAWGYRRKARLGVKYVTKKGRVLVGFREKGSGFLTDTKKCHVLHPLVGDLIQPLASLVASLSICQRLPQIEVAVDDQRALLVFRVLDTPSEADRQLLAGFGEQHGVAIYLQPGGVDSVMPLDGHAVELSYSIPEYQLSNAFLPTDFTQVNTDINRKMVSLALQLLDLQSDHRVLDLFCGLGNFTLPMARLAAEVTGVEGDDSLVERARQNALRNAIDNARYFVANLFESIEQSGWSRQTYDRILLDPPRSGAFELVQQIERFDAGRLVYVSCYPGTLARDLDVLVNQKGYHLQAVGVMDMFPHTGHVESIALLTR